MSQIGVNRKGFTLVEVMLAVAILGIGLSVIANSYLTALRGLTATQNNIQAVLLARQKLNDLEALSIIKKGLDPFSESDTLKSQGKDYNYSLNVTEIDESENLRENLVRACLSYSWQEQNALKYVKFGTYFLRYKEEAKSKSIQPG